METNRFRVLIFALLFNLNLTQFCCAEDTAGLELFESKIRPVLVKHCYECHSAQAQSEKKLKGGLLLDSRQGALKGGDTGPAVVPGDVDESLIVSALTHDSFEMPPAGKLPQNVIDDFVHWVKLGAPDPRDAPAAAARKEIDFDKASEFWSFQPPQKTAPPATINDSWPRTDLDRFVLARLEQNGLQPVGQASKRVLLRRASFDLIGLPPTPDEMQTFLSDESPEAFEKVVERLLASPHYGERWGRHWLDVARYAEDQAHTFSVTRRDHAHEYRDWVIEAFNADMPYDQFVKLQLAGDLIMDEDDPQRERLAGLGLLGLGAIYYKNSDKAKAIADELDDRIDTVTRGFLGLTVSCARCHDHKYDPIPTADYYSLAGVFQNTRMVDLPLESKEKVDIYKAAEAVVKGHEAKVKTFREQRKQEVAEGQRDKIASYMTAVWAFRQRQAANAKPNLDQLAKEFKLEKSWLDRWNKFLKPDNKDQKKFAALEAWRKLPQPDGQGGDTSSDLLSAATGFQNTVNEYLDLRDGKFSGQKGEALFASGQVDRERPLVDIRVDLKGSRQLFLVMTNAGDGDNSDWGDWLEPKLVGPEGERSLLEFEWKSASAAHHSVRKNLNCAGKPLKVDDKLYEVGIGTHSLSLIEYELPKGVTHFVAKGGLDGSGVGSVEFRVYNALPSDITTQPSTAEQKAREELLKTVFSENGLFGLDDKELTKFLDEQQTSKLAQLQEQVEAAKQKMPPPLSMAHVVQDTGNSNHKIYIRGNPEQQGDEAPRQFLRILAGKERTPFTEGSGRLELAEAIASPENPLTARVIVNRVWQHHFGRGLVGTASNFGELGDRPSHPELLDWLAVRFIESGWSLKWLHREIMLSATYQLSSELDSSAMKIDPENRFHWRTTRRRLEVEAWRDALLAVSGNLDTTLGGPTVKLADSNNHRRTVYGAISRHKLNGLLRLFDFPDANVTSAARTETTVPQQQLFVLNSEFVVDQAKALVDRVRKEAGENKPAQIALAYQLLFGRDPDADELSLGMEFISKEHDPQDKLSPWEQYAQALLGSNEFMYID